MYDVKIEWSDGNTYFARKDLSLDLETINDVLIFVSEEQKLIGSHVDYPADIKITGIHAYEVEGSQPSHYGMSQAMKMGQRQIAQAKMRGEWRGNAY
jgi:hypothetical protein